MASVTIRRPKVWCGCGCVRVCVDRGGSVRGCMGESALRYNVCVCVRVRVTSRSEPEFRARLTTLKLAFAGNATDVTVVVPSAKVI